MNPASGPQPWRLRIRVGREVGAGFVVARGRALTCAHVVGAAQRCDVDVPDLNNTFPNSNVEFVDPRWQQTSVAAWNSRYDIAVVSVPDALDPAPLGPIDPAEPGTELEVLGYPESYETALGDRAQATRYEVDRLHEGLIQAHRSQGFSGEIQPGYSGGPAIDTRSWLVAGMVVEASITDRIAWIIPLQALAESWPALSRLLPNSLEAHPVYTYGREDLNAGRYNSALTHFHKISERFGREPDLYFYRALAGLAGQRPALHLAQMVASIERLLAAGLRASDGAPHLRVLWALVKEDYYLGRRIPEPPGPTFLELATSINEIDDKYAVDIVRHVPAQDCHIYQWLERRLPQR